MTNEPKKAPIIEDGKTLEELVGENGYGIRLMKVMRAEGYSDEDIWATMMEF